MSLLLTFTTTITDAELAALPETIYWNMIGTDGTVVLIRGRALPKAMLRTGQIKLGSWSEGTAKAILTLQRGQLLFSNDEDSLQPHYTLDLAALCRNFPGYFKNLTNDLKCSEISPDDVGPHP